MINFCLQKDYEGREKSAIQIYANDNCDKVRFVVSEKPILGMINVGSVEFIEKLLGPIVPEYYPKWIKDHFHRQIWRNDLDGADVYFIKPADKYKRFDGYQNFIAPIDLGYKGDVWISEVVEFVDEWRYYVADGEVLCSWWYQGSEETCVNQPNGPALPFEIPKGFCGAIDMGKLSTGEFALVEVQHPYSIGWYGEMSDAKNYLDFLAKGWHSLIHGNK